MNAYPSAAEIDRLLSYDPNTGEFRWKARPDDAAFTTRRAGTVAGKLTEYGYIQIRVMYQYCMAPTIVRSICGNAHARKTKPIPLRRLQILLVRRVSTGSRRRGNGGRASRSTVRNITSVCSRRKAMRWQRMPKQPRSTSANSRGQHNVFIRRK